MNKAKANLYVPDYTTYAQPFRPLFNLVEKVEWADVVMFTGGTDINPELYGQRLTTHSQLPNYTRDLKEIRIYNEAAERGLPFLGICRGAQLLCAIAGGKLIQHTNGHHGDHRMMTNEGVEYTMSSLHHQMMIPQGTDHELIAWCERRSTEYIGEGDKRIDEELKKIRFDVEPEIVYFKKIKGLGIQGHPEHFSGDHPTLVYLRKLVEERLL